MAHPPIPNEHKRLPNEGLRFDDPEPLGLRPRIRPVFLPYAGCPHRCAFCNQRAQTGRDPAPLDKIFHHIQAELQAAADRGAPPGELGFFGGVFTGLPQGWPERFLELAARYRARGLVTRIRCSTRPDAIDLPTLIRLRDLGLDMVEIGVQSFRDAALIASRRGYSGDAARRACALVKDAGLSLGVQLMAGLPEQNQAAFVADVAAACALAPEAVRLYPCLVLEETALAALWREGRYRPWSTARAVASLAKAATVFWARGVRVIRMGLAPEPGLERAVLAGPLHPALGNRVRALALYTLVRTQVRALAGDTGQQPRGLCYPRRRQGEIWGHGRELAPAYQRLGLASHNARPWDEPYFYLY